MVQTHPNLRIATVLKVLCVFVSSFVIFIGADDAASGQAFNGADDYRWFTRIEDNDGNPRCSAAFIGSKFVLTANYCIEQSTPPSDFQAAVGFFCEADDNCNREQEVIPIVARYSPPSGGDLAILELANEVSIAVTPAIPLIRDINKKQKTLKTRTTLDLIVYKRDSRLSKIRTKVISSKRCARKNSPIRDQILNEKLSLICSVTINGAPCNGDGGAPLITRGKGRWKGRDVIGAVHLLGRTTCDEEAIGQTIVHFNVNDASDFIVGTVCGDPSAPDWCGGSTATPPRKYAKLLHTLVGHAGDVWSLDFHPNGSRLVSTGCVDFKFNIWDVASGSRLNSQTGHEGCVRAVRYSPDGTKFVTGSNDNRVKVWNAPSDPFETSIAGIFHDDDWAGGVESVSWRKDGQKIVSAFGDSTIRVHHVDEGSGTTTLADAHTMRVFGADYDNDGTHIATGSSSMVRIFENRIFEEKVFMPPTALLSSTGATISFLEYSPDGAYLAVSYFDVGTIEVWHVEEGVVDKRLTGHGTTVRQVRWSPDGQYVISGSRDNTARVWNVSTGAGMIILEKTAWLQTVAWSGDGTNTVAVGSSDDNIYVLKLRTLP